MKGENKNKITKKNKNEKEKLHKKSEKKIILRRS